MGKSSKLRKRQKIEKLVVGSAQSGTDSNSDVDEGNTDSSIDIAVAVLGCLSCRLDIFEDKSMKLLRVAIFPLIQVQKGKFFEDAVINPITDEKFYEVVTSKAISTTIQLANYYAQNIEEFALEMQKPLRRALHPLVEHVFKKIGGNVVRKGPVSALCAPEGTVGNQSLSNRISNCFRTRHYDGALMTLALMARVCDASNGNEAERLASLPKLGKLHAIVCIVSLFFQFVYAYNIHIWINQAHYSAGCVTAICPRCRQVKSPAARCLQFP